MTGDSVCFDLSLSEGRKYLAFQDGLNCKM